MNDIYINTHTGSNNHS